MEKIMQINIMYFASLRDSAKTSNESVNTNAKTINDLYEELNKRHNFNIEKEILRVAVNEEYKSFDTLLTNNDTIVFIPPVAGG
jgi:molybdopterin converting factor subunit 1